MKYKNILITGKTGSVGQNMDFGTGYSSKIFDLRDQADCQELFDRVHPDCVCHLGARVGGLQLHLDHKYDLFYDNVMINTNVLNEVKVRGIKRIVSFLSSCIFSEKSESPYTEEMVFDGQPHPVHRPYGFSKRMLAFQGQVLREECGILASGLIPTNLYGKFDNFNEQTGHVVGGLIKRAYLAAKNGTEFTCWGNGEQSRDFLYLSDAVELTKWAIDNYESPEPLILSNNERVRIGDLAHLIAKEFNIENKLTFDISKPTGQKERHLSGNKLNSLVDFKFTKIAEGVKLSCDWFKSNYPNVRL